jgi:hypothetical protein
METKIDISDALYEALREQGEKRNVSISTLVVQAIKRDTAVIDKGACARVWLPCDSGHP